MSDAMSQGSGEPALSPRPRAAPGGLARRAVSRIAVVIGLWLAVAIAYWPSTLALARLWINTAEETYTHGYLILLISLWLAFRERHRLAEVPVRPAPAALMALLLLSALWAWAWRAAIQEVQLMLLPLILLAAIRAVLGARAARLLAFPVGYLYFALPFWSDGNFILQALSARMTGVLLWLTGVPAFMQGNFIHEPGGIIRIAGGCSGLHAFIVGLALAALYGKVFDLPRRRRWGALALMGVLALIVNWLRIFIVATVAYSTDMHSSLVRNHYWLGWWLFAAAFAVFLWWMERTPRSRIRPHVEEPPQALADLSGSTESLPFSRISLPRTVATVIALAVAFVLLVAFTTGLPSSMARNHYWLGWSLCAAALAAFLWWVGRKRAEREISAISDGAEQQAQPRAVVHTGSSAAQIMAALGVLSMLPAAAYGMDWMHAGNSWAITIQWPAAPAGWEGPERLSASQWHPHFVHAGARSLRTYIDSRGQSVQVFAVAYRVQTQHAKLLGYGNRLLGKTDGLRPMSRRIVSSPAGRWIETRTTDGSGTHSLIWSRYQVGSRLFVDPRLSQLWYGLAALVNPPISSLTALRTACRRDCRAARARIEALAGEVQPTFETGPNSPRP